MIEMDKPDRADAVARYRDALAEIDVYAAQWRPPPRPMPPVRPASFPAWLIVTPLAVIVLLLLFGLLVTA